MTTLTHPRSLAVTIQSLSRPDSLSSALRTTVFFGAVLGLGYAAATTSSWLVLIGAQVGLGLVFAHGLELQHECLHHAMFRSPKLCRAVGFLFGLPMIVAYTHYRTMHYHHHKYLGTPQDAELFDYDADSLGSWPRFLKRAFNLARIPTFFVTLFGMLRGRFHPVFKNAVVQRQVVKHDEGVGQERGPVDLEVEPHVVPELEDAEVVAREPSGLRRAHRPHRVEPKPPEHPRALEPVEHRPVVGGDAGGRRWKRAREDHVAM